MQKQGSMSGFMLDKQGNLSGGFKEFDSLNDGVFKLLTHSSNFSKRQMGTLKGKIKIPDNFDSAFADEIADMFAGV